MKGTTNPILKKTIEELKELSIKEKSKIWKRVADDLSKPSRNRRQVNIYKINKFSKDGELIVVPGKVLSLGSLDKKLKIAAFNFSESAKKKIIDSGCEAISLDEAAKTNPKGKNARIIG